MSQSRAERRAAARQRQQVGAAWEKTLDDMHDAYRQARRAHIVRRGPPVQFLGQPKNGRVSVELQGKGPTDYGGLIAGGRCVDFDAKSCAGPRWAFKELKPHQAEHLDGVRGLGGFAFVALQIRSVGGAWVLPWAALGSRWHAWRMDADRARLFKTHRVRSGTASLSIDQCDAIGVRMLQMGDWLPVVEAFDG